MATRLLRYLVSGPGYLISGYQLLGYRATELGIYFPTGLPGFCVIKWGYRVNELRGYRVTLLQVYRAAGVPGYIVTELSDMLAVR